MSIEDEWADYNQLAGYPSAEEQKYVPRTEFDGNSGFIQTASFEAGESPDFDAILKEFGYDPDKVKIVGQPRVSRWQQRSGKRDKFGQRTGEYETVWLCAYRFHLAAVNGAAVCDLDALVKKARATKRAPAEDGHWFVFQAGDLQLGKRSRDGSTEQIVERYLESIEAAKLELRAANRLGTISGVQISMPGDCIEGSVSQKSKNLWLTQETITEQTRMLRRLMFETVKAFAPVAPKVYLDTVNGNHDESQREQNTYPGDGWATECAISVADALKLNDGAYGHVEVRVPNKWSGSMTVPVGDSVVTVIHGHQFRNNGAFNWWAGQAVGNHPAGAAQVLQSGHYHSWKVDSSETKTHVQSSTFDCGSDWYRDKTGASARRGAVIYLLKTGEVSRMSVV